MLATHSHTTHHHGEKPIGEVQLGWPVSLNAAKGIHNGHVYLRERYRLYRLDVASRIAKARSLGEFPKETITERVRVHLVYVEPDRRTRDIDNLQKGLFDALTKAKVWTDDKLVRGGGYEILPPDDLGGRVIVTILPYEPYQTYAEEA